jgi:hypothetical protein
LNAINEHFIATPRRVKALSQVNPQRIYVENIRSVLGTSTWVAKQICETAVRQGIFVKRIQLLCPGGEAYTVDNGVPVPKTIRCHKEVDGETEEYIETTDHLQRLEFYALVRNAV